MRSRAKPTEAKIDAKRSGRSKASKKQGGRIRDLEERLTGALKREAEALDQQNATSQILRVIAGSPSDLQPVLDTVAENAARVCGAFDAVLVRAEGETCRIAAHYGPIAAVSGATFPLTRGSVMGRAIIDRQPIHVRDLAEAEEAEFPEGRALARRIGHHTTLATPLMREGMSIGSLLVRRTEVRPFTDQQIALLQTFADQAVIAIENVRLFNELQEKNRALTQAHAQVTEALERQTATSDILKVMAGSPTDTQPVFDTIAENAARLCAARDAQVLQVDGDVLRLVSAYGLPSMPAVRSISRGHAVGRAVIDRRTIHVRDMAQAIAEFPETTAPQHGVQSVLAVPLVRHHVAIGVIRVSRTEIRPFTEAQIALLQTFADQAVIAIENVRLFNETKDALERQTATAEVLRVLSSSPTNVQPVMQTIVDSVIRLADADDAMIGRAEGDQIRWLAAAGTQPGPLQPISRSLPSGRAILDRRTSQVNDISVYGDEFPAVAAAYRKGVRTILAAPLLREGNSVGVVLVRRTTVRPFTDQQIALLKTFADQAVIAIENVRLFTELGARNRDLTTALDRQTATAEILGVISRSPADVRPVFEAVVESTTHLCAANDVALLLVDGNDLRIAAGIGPLYVSIPSNFRIGLTRGSVATRAVIDRATVHIHDFAAEPEEEFPVGRDLARRFGHRTMVAVPLLREGSPIGVICAFRMEVRPFPEHQIALLRTFADQAVIAIENVRLFTELQEKNRALTQAHGQVTEALEQQTATSEILRVISRSQTDVQPVFDTIVANAVNLCAARMGAVYRFDGRLLHLVAHHNYPPEVLRILQQMHPRTPQLDQASGRAVLTHAVTQIEDMLADPLYAQQVAVAGRWRSIVSVPMLRDGMPIGAIVITRSDPGPFADGHIELLKTFADQAVIAIENVRLFKELEARTHQLTRSVDELRALGEVGQAISSTLDLRTVLSTIVARATQLSDTDAGVIYEYDEPRQVFVPRATEHLETEIVETMLATPVRKGEGATGRLAEIQEPIQVPDILAAPAESRVRGALIRAGYRALLAVPLVREDHLIGGLTVIRKATGEFAPEVIELLRTFATQSALAIQNARLFLEIEDKSRQLEAASQHKSEFLANMSHELRTPLNAVIGFSEVLGERMFGELNEKQEEYLKDIHASGQHLLSLINDILDLSKIEAGRMELELTDFDLTTAIDNALTLVRERAGRRGIALHQAADEGLGQIRADERKIKQVLLNLLSNAIKFTPDGGRIDVRAKAVDGSAEVSVSDTGVGIAPEDQEAIFEEFRQVGTAAKKVEGTGLGLALSRKFVELHGGRIWVQSQVGVGSTFTFMIPLRPGA